MAVDHTHIALLESRWRDDSNITMRNLFELIADIATNNPNSFHYEMANTVEAVKEAIPRIASYRKCRYLCIGTHGDDGGLQFGKDHKLTRTELRNILKSIEVTDGSRLDGIYLSSCAFGTQKLANFLFEPAIRPVWIAGYAEYVNWIESSALDLLFFNELMRYEGTTDSPLQLIEKVAEKLLKTAPDLVRHLGFGIYRRKRGNGGGAQNILRSNDEDE